MEWPFVWHIQKCCPDVLNKVQRIVIALNTVFPPMSLSQKKIFHLYNARTSYHQTKLNLASFECGSAAGIQPEQKGIRLCLVYFFFPARRTLIKKKYVPALRCPSRELVYSETVPCQDVSIGAVCIPLKPIQRLKSAIWLCGEKPVFSSLTE